MTPSCLIPRFDGAICSLERKETLWVRYFAAAPRIVTRQAICKANLPSGHARYQSNNTAIHWQTGFCVAGSRDAQATTLALSRELGLNVKTLAKWRKRETIEDRKPGPTEPSATVLSEDEEAMIVAFRRHTLLPLDDWLYALHPTIPNLTRSFLHRCLQRHGIPRLPELDGNKPKQQKFKRYPIGYFHIDIAQLRTNEGSLYLFVAIDRTSKFAVAQLVDKENRKTAWEFLEAVLEAVPCKIHTILTDNGIQFCEQPRNRNRPYSRPMRSDMICAANGIEHRLTKPNHPWSCEDWKQSGGRFSRVAAKSSG